MIIALFENMIQMGCFYFDIFYLGETFTMFDGFFPLLSLIMFTRALGLNIGSDLLFNKKFRNIRGYTYSTIGQTLLVYILFGVMIQAFTNNFEFE